MALIGHSFYGGMLNGIGNVLQKIFGRFFGWVPRAVGVLATFGFSTFAWSLFRAESIAQARKLWGQLMVVGDGTIYKPITDAFNELTEVKLLGRLGFGGVIDQAPWICFAVFIIAVTAACFFLRNTQEKSAGYALYSMAYGSSDWLANVEYFVVVGCE